MPSIVLVLAGCTAPGSSGADVTAGEDRPSCEAAQDVVINELSATNVAALYDEEGDADDWIEILNADASPVELGGWGLSDDRDEPLKWRFPSFVLDPGELVIVHADDEDRARIVGSWDTRIDQGDDWRWLAVRGPVDADWAQPGFDDGGWPVGPSGFGHSDGDDATEVDADTIYVRTTFDVSADELADLAALYLHVDYDDAFVAYLNGVEVARAGIGRAGTPPAWDELGNVAHEAAMFEGGWPAAFDLEEALALVVEGQNTLALEVHDGAADSTDLSLVPFLSLGFASDRGGTPSPALHLTNAQLHASFSLKAAGERVGIYDANGCVADEVAPDRMLGDQSYGRQPDGAATLGYFLEPTPGASNATEMRPGFAPTPTFDPPPGSWPGGTSVTIGGSGATVHYALEGWEPTESDPTADGAIAIDAAQEAVVVRARAWQDGLWPSRIATATYFTTPPGELPRVSLVTNPPNLWDDETGIYTLGPDHQGPPLFLGANFYEDWERPVHLSEWEPDGQMGFAVDAGVKIHGGYSRSQDQKSLLVELDGAYGDDEIEHDVFPGLGIEEFDRLLLRDGGNDWIGCMSTGCVSGAHLRDPVMQRIARDTDVDVLAWRPAEVWINGEYWGVYHLTERPDASYVESHWGYDDIDLLEADAQPVRGDEHAWHETMDWIRSHDLSDPANYEHLEAVIDLDELASWLALEVFYDNGDWPGNNVKWWRPRTPDGRWRWLLYDTDFGLGLYGEPPEIDSLARALDPNGSDWPNPPWSTELFRLLMAAPRFRELFVNRYADYLNTILVPDRMQDTLHALEAEIAPGMPHHLERWGSWTDGATSYVLADGKWEDEIWWIDTWMERRPAYARQHLVSDLGLAGTWTLSLDADPPGAGTFRLTAVTVEPPFEGTYFQGVPVTITAIPANGHDFVGWSDPELPATPTITVDARTATSLVARFD